MGLGFIGFLQFLTGLYSFPFFAGYLVVVSSWGYWRRLLPPLHLKAVIIYYSFNAMLVHNLCCVLLSAVTLLGMAYAVFIRAPHIYSREEDWFLTQCFRLYWFTKYFEWLDTAFMMLRQKARQISFLHVYHHSAMVLLSDYAANVSPWPCMGFPLGLNSLVHIFVYSYYAAASLTTVTDSYKMALTKIQIGQFFMGLLYCGWGFLRHQFCVYSILFGLTMLYLFGNFYFRTYHGRKRQTEAAQNGDIKKD